MTGATAAISSALRNARLQKGLGQKDVGRMMFMSHKSVSAIENGRRKLPHDVGPSIARALDDPELYCALQVAATGGVAIPFLNGPKVDLHRSSVRAKTIEEVKEALRALEEADCLINAKGPEDLGPEGERQVDECIHQLIEAQTGCQIMVAVLCRQYGRSMGEAYEAHRKELVGKGFLVKEGSVR